MFYILHLKCLFFCLHRFQRKHCIFKSIAYKLQNGQNIKQIRNKLKTVRSELKLRENPFALLVRETVEATALRRWRSGTVWDDQLPEGWDWLAPLRVWLSSVLWFDAVAAAPDGAETAGVVEEELTPLEVLTELCWMASLWGLLGTDISSQLSSLSLTATTSEKKKTEIKGVWGAAVFILPDTLQKAWASCVTQA